MLSTTLAPLTPARMGAASKLVELRSRGPAAVACTPNYIASVTLVAQHPGRTLRTPFSPVPTKYFVTSTCQAALLPRSLLGPYHPSLPPILAQTDIAGKSPHASNTPRHVCALSQPHRQQRASPPGFCILTLLNSRAHCANKSEPSRAFRSPGPAGELYGYEGLEREAVVSEADNRGTNACTTHPSRSPSHYLQDDNNQRFRITLSSLAVSPPWPLELGPRALRYL
ncbi:hypothetical protein MIND_00561400 [Mycena indigotica]|uniref:Uncharacterized protein n=1 Tax=Mycena indigotica TaxID=2126181 RepID=A0A8H6SR10_9AGAR|nr:uncharacterized protein MIND_00561400 [Mycena indigotica]KAF7303337.1 hypothetical protein MIND_00561400 [Mycena indigotica]